MKTVSDDFMSHETSEEQRPAEGYHFWRGNANWRYTSGLTSVICDGVEYTPTPIDRETIQFNSDLSAHTMDIGCTRTVYPFVDFGVHIPVDKIGVTVFRFHRDQSVIEKVPIFSGVVDTIAVAGAGCVVRCVSIEQFLLRYIPRWRFQPGCNHSLYDPYCQVTEVSFQDDAVLSAIGSNGLTLTSSTFGLEANTWYTLGILYFGSEFKRTITSHIEDDIVIRYPIPNLQVGSTVTVSAGCDKNLETCRDKFSNVVNSMAFPFISADNPVLWGF